MLYRSTVTTLDERPALAERDDDRWSGPPRVESLISGVPVLRPARSRFTIVMTYFVSCAFFQLDIGIRRFESTGRREYRSLNFIVSRSLVPSSRRVRRVVVD